METIEMNSGSKYQEEEINGEQERKDRRR